MGAPYDNIPGVDSGDNFHPDIRAALLASVEFDALTKRLGPTALLTTDWNTAITNGWYYGTPTTTNGPGAVYTIGEVVTAPLSGSPGYYTQTVWEYASDNAANTKCWRRDGLSGVFSAWYPVLMSQTELDARYQSLIAAGTTAQYYRGDKTWQTLNSTAVGLGNVNNTADSAKPISTAVQTALDLLPKGLLYKKQVTGNTGGVADAIVDNIPTFTFKAGRRYRIVWDTSYYLFGTGDLFYCNINTAPTADAAANLANLTLIQGRTKGVNQLSGSTQHTGIIQGYIEPVGSDLTVQLKFRAQRVVGSQSMVFVGNTNENRFYYIYDDGAQTIGTA